MYYIDWLRAVGALGVLLTHITFAYAIQHNFMWPIVDSQATITLGYLINALCEFLMPLFFLLAGYFANKAYKVKGLKYFIKQRLIHIVIPLGIGLLILSFIHTFTMLGYAVKKFGLMPSIVNHQISLTQLITIAFSMGNLSEFYNSISYFWFLYYLLILYVLTCIIILIFNYYRISTANNYLTFLDLMLSSFYKPFILALPVTVILAFSPTWYVNIITTVIPNITMLAIYAYYYWIGWLIYHRDINLIQFKKFGWRYLALQLVIILPIFCFLDNYLSPNLGAAFYPLKILAGYLNSCGAWLSIFFLFSISMRYFNKPNVIVRYLADASYWIYLSQIPILVPLQIYMLTLQLSIYLKIIIIFTVTLTVVLLTYQLFVRYTFIGKLLNRRNRR